MRLTSGDDGSRYDDARNLDGSGMQLGSEGLGQPGHWTQLRLQDSGRISSLTIVVVK